MYICELRQLAIANLINSFGSLDSFYLQQQEVFIFTTLRKHIAMRRLGFKFACGQSLINQTYVSFAFCYKNIYFLCFWSSKLTQVKSCVWEDTSAESSLLLLYFPVSFSY